MTKFQNHVITLMKPEFYKGFVDDSITKRKKNEPNALLEKLNAYHVNIKFTVDVSHKKFLGMKLSY